MSESQFRSTIIKLLVALEKSIKDSRDFMTVEFRPNQAKIKNQLNKSIGEGQTLYGLIYLGNIKNSERNKGERRENEWEISERETELERLLTLGNELEVVEGEVGGRWG